MSSVDLKREVLETVFSLSGNFTSSIYKVHKPVKIVVHKRGRLWLCETWNFGIFDPYNSKLMNLNGSIIYDNKTQDLNESGNCI